METDMCTDGQTDRQADASIPPQTSFAGQKNYHVKIQKPTSLRDHVQIKPFQNSKKPLDRGEGVQAPNWSFTKVLETHYSALSFYINTKIL